MSETVRCGPHSVIKRSSGLSTHYIDDCVVVSTGSGFCYGMELMASRIWQLVDQPRRFPELCRMLMEAYTVDRKVCEQDVMEFLVELDREGLVEISDVDSDVDFAQRKPPASEKNVTSSARSSEISNGASCAAPVER